VFPQANMDRISKKQRSANMAAIKSAHTLPELRVRRALFQAGLRYRLHDGRLPGHPDIVFKGRRLVVFVHGCFWHGCTKCIDGVRDVKSNVDYWRIKIKSNRERDERNRKRLVESGWKVEEVWECECGDESRMLKLISDIVRREHYEASEE
jgi:DNA mismatch endonuclease (patch repair protein)